MAEPVRRLSSLEAEAAYRHALTSGNAQLTTQFTVRALFTPEQVEDAAAQWWRRFAVLSLQIAESAGELWFHRSDPEEVAPGGLVRQAVLPDGSSPDDILREEVDDVLPPSGRLWRLRAVSDPAARATHFYLTCQRAVCDDYASARLIRAYLDLLPWHTPCTERPGGRPPGLEALLSDSDTLTYLPAGYVTTEPAYPLRRTDTGASPRVVTTASHGAREKRGIGLEPLYLSQRECRRLKQRCGKAGVTVMHLLAAALAHSFARSAGREEVALHTTVSLRGRYAESVLVTQVGYLQAAVGTRLRSTHSALTDAARDYAASLAHADAAWRPHRRRHADIRRAVTTPAVFGGAGGLCITGSGSVEVALGPHAERVSAFRTAAGRVDATAVGTLHVTSFRGAFDGSLTFAAPCGDGGVPCSVAALVRAALLPTGRS
ncbi:hypothetical protein N566_25245 [Streptomycetaceae bacterium MP113-05]|nr:hypothetical protein N566_25245 [Streptomycetaceae bacterium MP113-05]